MSAVPIPHRTLADAAQAEADTDTRHELVDGELFAMAGGTYAHNLVSANTLAGLHAALRGRPCRVLGSDQRVHIQDADAGLYPDVSVYCGPVRFSPELSTALVGPTVVVEVLSPGTEAYDRGRKFNLYRSIPTLQHYVLVSQERVEIEVFDRNDDGTWTLRFLRPGATLELAAVEASVRVDDIYDGAFDEPVAPQDEQPPG